MPSTVNKNSPCFGRVISASQSDSLDKAEAAFERVFVSAIPVLADAAEMAVIPVKLLV